MIAIPVESTEDVGAIRMASRGLPTDSRLALLLGRWVLLILVAGAALFTFFSTRERVDGETYACPMHRSVAAKSPGNCPICGMPLERLSAGDIALLQDTPDVPRHDTSRVIRQRLTRPVRAAAWIERPTTIVALLSPEDAETLRPGDHGKFLPADASRSAIEVRLVETAGSPVDGSRVRREFAMARAFDEPRPTEVGWIDMGARSFDALVVPAPAILESPEGPFVLTASGDGRSVAKRMVRLGRGETSVAVVLSGLEEGEHVVTMNAFSLEAERRIHGEVEDQRAGVAP